MLEPLGRGASAVVLRAELTEAVDGLAAGTAVALKLPLVEDASIDDALAGLQRELRLARRVRANGVARAHAAGLDESVDRPQPWLVLELVEGRSLRAVLDELGRLPETLLQPLALRAAESLAALHAAGLVHRDVKAENFVLTPSHELKLIDLGLALDLHSVKPPDTAFAGTASHAAPEVLSGGAATPASDRHALGVLLHEAACGALPFEGRDLSEAASQRLGARATPLSVLVPGISEQFEAVVGTLLEAEPDARFADSDELASALREGEDSQWWSRRVRERERPAAAWWPQRPVPDARLAGRAQDLARLRERFAAAAGGTGGALRLVGEAGLGKTRLLHELVAALEAEGRETLGLHGATPPPGTLGLPGAIGRSLVQRFGRTHLHVEIAERVPGAPELRARLVDRLLGRERASRGPVAAGVERLLESLSGEAPVLWLLEDVQDADQHALELMTALARAARGRRALVVLATRPGRAAEQLASALPGSEELRLEALSPEAVRDLVAERLESQQLAERVGEDVARLTGGSPLHVLRLLEALAADGTLGRDAAGRRRLERAVAQAASLPELLLQRREQLDEDDGELLDAAALEGDPVEPSLLAAALGRDPIETAEALARLELRTRLVLSGGGELRFDHPLTRETLRDAVEPERRRRLHARLAEAHEQRPEPRAAAVVAHRIRSGGLGAARERLVPVLEALDRGCVHSELLDLSTRALELLGPDEHGLRSQLHRLRASTLALLGDEAERAREQEQAVREAERSGDSALLRARRRELAVLAWESGDAARACELAEEVAAQAREAGDADVERRALALLGRAHAHSGRLEQARAAHERCLELARAEGDRDAEADARGLLGGVLFRLRDLEGARTCAEPTLAHWREAGDRFREAYALEALGAVRNELGEREDARTCHEEARRLFGQVGHAVGEAGAAMSLANDLLQLGRPGEARSVAEEALAVAKRLGRVDLECGLLVNAALAALDCGRTDAAITDLERAVELMEAQGFEPWRAYALSCLGRARQRAGDSPRAIEEAGAALEAQRRLGVPEEIGKAALALGWIHLRGGRTDDARPLIDEAATLLPPEAAGLDDPPPAVALAVVG